MYKKVMIIDLFFWICNLIYLYLLCKFIYEVYYEVYVKIVFWDDLYEIGLYLGIDYSFFIL